VRDARAKDHEKEERNDPGVLFKSHHHIAAVSAEAGFFYGLTEVFAGHFHADTHLR
jgi:hypothetical protein